MHCADSYVLVAVEMVTRFALVEHIHDRKSETILGVLLRWFGELPEAARRTITFDNGTEFSQHYGLCDILGMDTYFCSVGAPHERGGVENFQGRLRRDLPRGMKLKERPEWYVAACGAKHNGMLRKCLKWDTPAQAMERELSLLGL